MQEHCGMRQRIKGHQSENGAATRSIQSRATSIWSIRQGQFCLFNFKSLNEYITLGFWSGINTTPDLQRSGGPADEGNSKWVQLHGVRVSSHKKLLSISIKQISDMVKQAAAKHTQWKDAMTTAEIIHGMRTRLQESFQGHCTIFSPNWEKR